MHVYKEGEEKEEEGEEKEEEKDRLHGNEGKVEGREEGGEGTKGRAKHSPKYLITNFPTPPDAPARPLHLNVLPPEDMPRREVQTYSQTRSLSPFVSLSLAPIPSLLYFIIRKKDYCKTSFLYTLSTTHTHTHTHAIPLSLCHAPSHSFPP